MNSVQVVGTILQIIPPSERSTSARLLVRYGPIRKKRNNTTRQFVNAVQVRIPERNLDTIEGLKPGMLVEVLARLQGIARTDGEGSDRSEINTEVVASRIVRFRLQEAEGVDEEGSDEETDSSSSEDNEADE